MLKDSCHLSHCVRLWMLCATNVSRFNSNCIVRQDCAKPNTPAWSDSLRLTPVCWAPAHGLSISDSHSQAILKPFSSHPRAIREPSRNVFQLQVRHPFSRARNNSGEWQSSRPKTTQSRLFERSSTAAFPKSFSKLAQTINFFHNVLNERLDICQLTKHRRAYKLLKVGKY